MILDDYINNAKLNEGDTFACESELIKQRLKIGIKDFTLEISSITKMMFDGAVEKFIDFRLAKLALYAKLYSKDASLTPVAWEEVTRHITHEVMNSGLTMKSDVAIKLLDIFEHFPNFNVDAPNAYGETMLMGAVASNSASLPLIKKLIGLGADVQVKMRHGLKAVHYLAHNNKRIELNRLEFLLSVGANPHEKAPHGIPADENSIVMSTTPGVDLSGYEQLSVVDKIHSDLRFTGTPDKKKLKDYSENMLKVIQQYQSKDQALSALSDSDHLAKRTVNRL